MDLRVLTTPQIELEGGKGSSEKLDQPTQPPPSIRGWRVQNFVLANGSERAVRGQGSPDQEFLWPDMISLQRIAAVLCFISLYFNSHQHMEHTLTCLVLLIS